MVFSVISHFWIFKSYNASFQIFWDENLRTSAKPVQPSPATEVEALVEDSNLPTGDEREKQAGAQFSLSPRPHQVIWWRLFHLPISMNIKAGYNEVSQLQRLCVPWISRFSYKWQSVTVVAHVMTTITSLQWPDLTNVMNWTFLNRCCSKHIGSPKHVKWWRQYNLRNLRND